MTYHCIRCEEDFDSTLETPKRCAECGSPLWDVPRKRKRGAGRPIKSAESSPAETPVESTAFDGEDLEMPWDIPAPDLPVAVTEAQAHIAETIEKVTGELPKLGNAEIDNRMVSGPISDPSKPVRRVVPRKVKGII